MGTCETPVGWMTQNILSKTASHAPRRQNSLFLDLLMGWILARASAQVLGPAVWERDHLRPWTGASGVEVLQNTKFKWAQQKSPVHGAELNRSVNKPSRYFPNGSCCIQTTCYTRTVWRWKNMKKPPTFNCKRQILGTKYSFAQPSLPAGGLVPSVTHVCSSLHRCPHRCQGTLPWDRGRRGAGICWAPSLCTAPR